MIKIIPSYSGIVLHKISSRYMSIIDNRFPNMVRKTGIKKLYILTTMPEYLIISFLSIASTNSLETLVNLLSILWERTLEAWEREKLKLLKERLWIWEWGIFSLIFFSITFFDSWGTVIITAFLHTLISSIVAWWRSGTCSSVSLHKTTSNSLSWKGSSCISTCCPSILNISFAL